MSTSMLTCTSKGLKWYLLTNLTESSYLICTLLIDILRFPIIVEIRELSQEFPEDGCKIIRDQSCYFKCIHARTCTRARTHRDLPNISTDSMNSFLR